MGSLDVVVVVGTGAAGTTAARTLRAEGFGGRLVLLGDEPAAPYKRPPLSKGYLTGDTPRERLRQQDDTSYAELGIELLPGTAAVRLDRGAGEVELGDGGRLRYDRLLLATGAAPRRLQVPGAELAGVQTLRTLADADALRKALAARTGRLVVVGGSWIGAEVASSARQRGWDVTIVDPAAVPLARAVGPEMGAYLRDLHPAHGVRVLTAGVASVEGNGHVEAVVTTDGDRLGADLVVVGIGVVPRTELAAAAGLEVGDGVVVDPLLTTSDPRVLAAGDVASVSTPRYGRHLRVEHWEVAKAQGRAAALAILGRGAAYDAVPFFYSDQYDVGLEFRGRLQGGERLVLRGRPGDGPFVAFWLRGDRVAAAMNVDVWDAADALARLVTHALPADAARLADPAVPLADAA